MNDTNCSVNVPGLWHNGDCSLLCRETKWYDYLIFFFGNYVAHIATVTLPPSFTLRQRVLYTTMALFVPISGFSQGFRAIRTSAIFAATPLQQAARLGPLYMLIKVPRETSSNSASGGVRGTRSRQKSSSRGTSTNRHYPLPSQVVTEVGLDQISSGRTEPPAVEMNHQSSLDQDTNGPTMSPAHEPQSEAFSTYSYRQS